MGLDGAPRGLAACDVAAQTAWGIEPMSGHAREDTERPDAPTTDSRKEHEMVSAPPDPEPQTGVICAGCRKAWDGPGLNCPAHPLTVAEHEAFPARMGSSYDMNQAAYIGAGWSAYRRFAAREQSPRFESDREREHWESEQNISDCCKAEVRFGGGTGATRYYVCSVCEKACGTVRERPDSIEQQTRPCFVASNGDLLMLTDEQAENVAKLLGDESPLTTRRSELELAAEALADVVEVAAKIEPYSLRIFNRRYEYLCRVLADLAEQRRA